LDEEANVEDVKTVEETRDLQQVNPEPQILEEICVEELAIDGICGVY
jgi:mycofactocin precursor